MNARKTFILASALSLAVTGLQATQPDEDSSAGTWKLNISKSTFAQNPSPKSETRTYTVTPEGTAMGDLPTRDIRHHRRARSSPGGRRDAAKKD